MWITTNYGKFLNRWEYQTTLPLSWETCMKIKKEQLEPYIEQLTSWKLGKEYDKAVYCHPVYLIYMNSTSCEMLGWMNHRLESRLLGWITGWYHQICRWYHSNGRKWRGTKEPPDEGERGGWKAGLKLNIQKTKIMASSPITSWQIEGGKVETVTDFIFLGSKITADSDWGY